MRQFLKLLFMMIVIFLTSCNNDIESPSDVTEPSSDILIRVDDELTSLVNSEKIKNVQEAIEFASKFPEFTNAKTPNDKFVSLYFGKYEYFIDFGGNCCLKTSGMDDGFDVANEMKEYDDHLGITWPKGELLLCSRSSSTEINSLLTKRNVMIWNVTAEQEEFSEEPSDIWNYFNVLKVYGRRVRDTYYNYNTVENHKSAYMLSQLKQLANFDLVYIICHGDIYGRLLLPMDGTIEQNCTKGIVYDDDGSIEKFYAINKEWFDDNIPSADLSNTVIWTATCYAFTEGGSLYDFCEENNAADFYGADGTIKYFV